MKSQSVTSSEWKLVGKLDKRKAFSGYPLESLHKEIKKLVPRIRSVSEVGVSSVTNEYLREKLEKYARKEFPFLSDRKISSTVGMVMLNYSPCDVNDGEDFHVYVRKVK